MELTKKDKWLVIRWIDQQFAAHSEFPEGPADAGAHDAGESCHIWHSWRLLPVRWRFIEPWLEQHLSAQEQVALVDYVRRSREH